ncbi:MAG TPA: sigma 54-interacting transcriptional regulator [Longimicrobiales bacterium]|nr:sigma 54-interacting transcriptional regulator [Longimicrobiales bacterium]
MRPIIAVVQLGESFADVWQKLIEGEDAECVIAAGAEDLPPQVVACIVSAAGMETECVEAVQALRAAGARPVAVAGADTGHRAAAVALRAGASEYFALPGDQAALRGWLGERCAGARARERAGELARAERSRYDFTNIAGESEELLAALERASRVIPHRNATVLLTGETGTGKDLLARAIHYNGPRASQPFVEINCTAIPGTLLEAELFGFERGAFTDAKAAKPGLFEAAHGGTLFLDEIGDISLEAQAKLLRVLQDRQVRRLGSVRSFDIDVRVVAATNVDLSAAVSAGRFRSDLYYRLSVVPIQLPPLRDRGNDVLLLAERFLAEFAHDHDMPVPELNAGARRALVGHDWPGNIRELRNAIERAVLLGGPVLGRSDVLPDAPRAAAGVLPFPARMDEIEVAAAKAMVMRFDGNKSLAADALGISRSRLYRLLSEAAPPEA